MRHAAPALLLALLGFAALPCAAKVHKCVDARGKVTYQDEACRDGGSKAASGVDTSEPVKVEGGRARATPPRAASAPDDGSVAGFRGAWRGAGQLRFSAGGRQLADADERATTVLELRPDGSAGGFLNGTGCLLSGRYTAAASVASLELDFAQCRDGRYNRRYAGHLIASPGAAEARLNLHSASFQSGANGVSEAALSATLRR